MKRKFTLSVLGIACVALSLGASPRSASEALRVARSFYEGKSLLRSVSDADFRLVYTGGENDLRSSSDDPSYYIYNVGEAEGFVLVSGDDRTRSILGYSLSGSFDPSDMPSHLSGWFSGYDRQVAYARTLPERPFSADASSSRSDKGFPERVEPLIRTQWAQEAPYNDLCPMDGEWRSYTGCVATAAAQVMNYHQWPEKAVGKGQYQMSDESGEVVFFPVDLSGYTFDWKNMSDTYDSTSTTAQKKAVAELMYAAGVASDMEYSAKGSAAWSLDLAKGLIEHFNYDKHLVYRHRDFYPSEEWKDLLKTELTEKRPVLYRGSSPAGGHAFVCDGYDKEGLFHINWGWSGSFNGYFELDALDPGTGASGFSYDQGMITGMRKPTENSVPYSSLYTHYALSSPEISQGDTLFLDRWLMLEASSAQTLETAWGLFDDKNKLYKLFGESTDLYDPFVSTLFAREDTIPSFRLEPGLYRLRSLYRTPGDKEWSLVNLSLAYNSEIFLMASDSLIRQMQYHMDLSGIEPIHADDAYVAGDETVLRTVIRNESDREYNPMIYFIVYSLSVGEMATISKEGFYLRPLEEKELQTKITLYLSPGRYVLAAYASDAWGELSFIEGTESMITVTDTPTGIESVSAADDLRVSQGDGFLSVSFASALQEAYLYDVAGILRSTAVMGGAEASLSTAGLPAGIYVLKVRSGQVWMNKKVIVQ